MKITSLVAPGSTLELSDLGYSMAKVGSNTNRCIALGGGESMYLVETGDVVLSAQQGDIYINMKNGKIALNDTIAGVTTINHGFNFTPHVSVVDSTGTDVTAASTIVNNFTGVFCTSTTVTPVGAAPFIVRVS